jgi:hypothetical protein
MTLDEQFLRLVRASGLSTAHFACRKGRLDIIEDLLATNSEKSSTDLDLWSPNINGWTCLHFAARCGSLPLVDRLLSQRSCEKIVFAKNLSGQSCLGVASRAGHTTVAKRLLVAFVEKNFVVESCIREDILPGSRVSRELTSWAAEEVSNYRLFRGLVLFGMRGPHSGSPHLSKLRNVHRAKRLLAEFIGPLCCKGAPLDRFVEISKILALSPIRCAKSVVVGRKTRGIWYSQGDECPKKLVPISACGEEHRHSQIGD